MARGGKRTGAGRPIGAANRPTIFDFWNASDLKAYFKHLKATYKNDSRLTVFVGEHIMGKAQQPVDLTSKGESIVDHELKSKADIAIVAYLNAHKK